MGKGIFLDLYQQDFLAIYTLFSTKDCYFEDFFKKVHHFLASINSFLYFCGRINKKEQQTKQILNQTTDSKLIF